MGTGMVKGAGVVGSEGARGSAAMELGIDGVAADGEGAATGEGTGPSPGNAAAATVEVIGAVSSTSGSGGVQPTNPKQYMPGPQSSSLAEGQGVSQESWAVCQLEPQ